MKPSPPLGRVKVSQSKRYTAKAGSESDSEVTNYIGSDASLFFTLF